MRKEAHLAFRASRVTLDCLGDIGLSRAALAAALRGGIERASLRLLAPLRGADLVLANLESPVTDRAAARDVKRYNLRTGRELVRLFDGR